MGRGWIWEDVYGGRDSLVRVIAWQATSDPYWTDGIVLGQNNTGKNADVLAIAPYMSFNVGPNTNPNVDTVSKWNVEQVLDHIETVSLPESIQWIKTQKKVADKYGLKLICYEAGQHLVGIQGGENNNDLTKLFLAANRHPRMGIFYTQYMDAWETQGGDLMCIFSSTGQWSKWGSWGLTEYLDETENDQPKFKAVMDWNRKHSH
jgi:hypothetical protein